MTLDGTNNAHQYLIVICIFLLHKMYFWQLATLFFTKSRYLNACILFMFFVAVFLNLTEIGEGGSKNHENSSTH